MEKSVYKELGMEITISLKKRDRMNEILNKRKESLLQFIQEKRWSVYRDKSISHGHQYVITDGTNMIPVNIYNTGKTNIQGKQSDLQTTLREWANLEQARKIQQPKVQAKTPLLQSRVAKFLVIPSTREKIRKKVIPFLADNVGMRDATGASEEYRAEVRDGAWQVTVTQYESGTLLVQGASTPLFDQVCDRLDKYLRQSFSETAARFIPGKQERENAIKYLENPESENEAATWIIEKLGIETIKFLHINDQHHLLAGAGVRNAMYKQELPDYSVIVMPFAKVYEGFLIQLAFYLNLIDEDKIQKNANAIQVGGWIKYIQEEISDKKRYSEIVDSLSAAWGCRNKVIHSDPGHSLSVLKTMADAEQEINIILRAISRAYHIFVIDKVKLNTRVSESKKKIKQSSKTLTFSNIDRNKLKHKLLIDKFPVRKPTKGQKNLWKIEQGSELLVVAPHNNNVIIVSGSNADEFVTTYKEYLVLPKIRIGVDESGKGDLFGPLVIAGVALPSDIEVFLIKKGVRDSKSLSASQIFSLAQIIQNKCEFEIIELSPPEYNLVYVEKGENLNLLLAWGHAQVIAALKRRTDATEAISDQFGAKELLIKALSKEKCTVNLEQRHQAEDDIAVAAASILARAVFLKAIDDISEATRIKIPKGSSSPKVLQVGREIYSRQGREGLERVVKAHFKTVKEITGVAK